MVCMRRGNLFFIILLIGLNNLSADEDITEAISDATEVITTRIEDAIKDSPKSVHGDDDDKEEEGEMRVQNPTVQRLPADSETIRHNIIDSQFSCDEREPGFYADIENDCQIFHRCLQDRHEVFSFICPEQTVFDQRILVCISDDDYNIPCETSEQYYRESNRAFFGNATAEESMEENMKNSLEIKAVAVAQPKIAPVREEVKLFEIIPVEVEEEELAVTSEESATVEKDSLVEEGKEPESYSDDYQAEFIPNAPHHIDASLATSSSSELDESLALDDRQQPPQKLIALSVLDPIVELPSQKPITLSGFDPIIELVTEEPTPSRHRKRFLFRADALSHSH